jgi:hypothetical protein
MSESTAVKLERRGTIMRLEYEALPPTPDD